MNVKVVPGVIITSGADSELVHSAGNRRDVRTGKIPAFPGSPEKGRFIGTIVSFKPDRTLNGAMV